MACRVQCMTRVSRGAVSSSVAVDSNGWNHEVASGLKSCPGLKGVHKASNFSPAIQYMPQELMKQEEVLELEFNRGTGAVTKIETPRKHHIFQQQKAMAPIPPRMQHPDKDEVERISQGVEALMNSQKPKDSINNSVDPIKKGDKAASEYRGYIKIYDSENHELLLISRHPSICDCKGRGKCRQHRGKACLCCMLSMIAGFYFAGICF